MGYCFTELARNINRTVTFILDNAELDIDEKAGLIANVLINDDERRQQYLIALCQPENDNYFPKGYMGFDTVRKGIANIIDNTEDDYDHEDDAVDLIMQLHMGFINVDINNFFQSGAVAEKIQKRERIENFKKRAIMLGGIAVASGVGSAIATWLTK